MRRTDFACTLGLIVFLVLGLMSCVKKDEVEESFLRLEKSAIEFAKQGGEATINVSTNREQWVATSPDEGKWLQLEIVGNALRVQAKSNVRATPRTSHILISTGSETRVVDVSQGAADVILGLAPETLNVPQPGGTYMVDVRNNGTDWLVELQSQVDWLEVRANLSAQIVTLLVRENKSAETRDAKLIVLSENKRKTVELSIVQEGKTVLPEYSLPFFEKKIESVVTLIEYERSIGHYYHRMIAKGPRTGPEDVYLFFPRSSLAERGYLVNEKGIITQIKEASFNDKLIRPESGYIDFLKAQGFEEELKASSQWQGLNKDKGFSVLVSAIPNKGTLTVFTREVEQKQAFPTWDKLPLDVLFAYVWDENIKVNQVFENEEAAGSTNIDFTEKRDGSAYMGQIETLSCKVAESKRPHVANGYVFAWDDEVPRNLLGSVSEKITAYDKVDLVFWKDAETGKILLTREFKTLMLKEGWKFEGVVEDGGFLYSKAEKRLLFRSGEFNDIPVQGTVLVINAFTEDGGESEGLIDFPVSVSQEPRSVKARSVYVRVRRS